VSGPAQIGPMMMGLVVAWKHFRTLAVKSAEVAPAPFAFHRIRSTHRAREGPGSNASLKYWVSRATFPSLNSMMLTV
jgi:hypothetical protein